MTSPPSAGPGSSTEFVLRPAVEPTATHRSVARQLGIACTLLAAIELVPALWETFRRIQLAQLHAIPMWVYIMTAVAAGLFAGTLYVRQFPDWSSAWIVTAIFLAFAMGYAFVFAITLFASQDSRVVQFLDLNDLFRSPQVRLWCLCMVSLASLFALVAGRVSAGWHRAWRTQFEIRRRGDDGNNSFPSFNRDPKEPL